MANGMVLTEVELLEMHNGCMELIAPTFSRRAKMAARRRWVAILRGAFFPWYCVYLYPDSLEMNAHPTFLTGEYPLKFS